MKNLIFAITLLAFNFLYAQQNVGIGTTSPAEKLHVNGNVKADTLKSNAIKLTLNAGINKVLTSDAVGNAGWEELNNQTLGAAGNVGYGAWGDCATNISIGEYQPVGDSTGNARKLGEAVAISGNFTFAGAPDTQVGSNVGQGAVFVYKHNGNNWELFAKLTDPDGAANDRFGQSVAVSGNYAIIGIYADDVGTNDGQGSAIIYRFNGINWVVMQKITDPAGAAGDLFGWSVSISGNYALVGAYSDDIGANVNQGSACVFELSGNSWLFDQKLIASTGASQDLFGYSVSISGTYTIVGAARDVDAVLGIAGSVCIYWFSGTSWVQRWKINGGLPGANLGTSVSIDGNYAVAGMPGTTEGGAAVVYVNTGTNWSTYSSKVISRAAIESGDNFGQSVSISGNNILVGANNDDVGTSYSEGGVSLFIKVGSNWQQQQYITDPAGNAGNKTGNSVAIDKVTKRFIIGASNAFSNDGKAIFGKVN